MSEFNKAKQVLSTGQVTFLFLMLISILIVFFAAGICVGRWTQPSAGKDGTTASVKMQNIRYVQDNVAIIDSSVQAKELDKQAVTQSVSTAAQKSEESKLTTGYAVQVSTMPTFEEAESLVTQLRRDGFSTSQARVPQSGSVNQMYSVEIGPYYDKTSAEQVVSQLKSKGLTRSRTIAVYTPRERNTARESSAAAIPSVQ
ncbi:MAG TPA: SPOR domain-containing protein [Blastocatellia bacterium]|nr:SPOR domain-containing protein [Blastocatellia bacterium]